MNIINIGIIQLLISFLLVSVILFITYQEKLSIEKNIFKATAKMVVQLFILGYILVYLLTTKYYILGFMYMGVMFIFGVYTIRNKISKKNNLNIIIISLLISTIGTLIYIIVGVVQPRPLIEFQYIIPMYGMILGNSITALTIGVNSYWNILDERHGTITTLYNIGVSPEKILKPIFNESLTRAITPTLTMVGITGLIALPGMMTGQILGGVDPLIAVKYQMVILIGILSSVFFSIYIYLKLLEKKVINKYKQIQL